jgi:hypothetical protein
LASDGISASGTVVLEISGVVDLIPGVEKFEQVVVEDFKFEGACPGSDFCIGIGILS